MELVWGFGLFVVALLLLVMELFIPSAGILGIMAAIAAIGGIVACFAHSPAAGATSLLVVMVGAPFLIYLAFKIYPSTPIGRRLILGSTTPGDDSVEARHHEEEQAREQERLTRLIGVEGVVVTDCRPVGTIRIEGQRVQALAESGVLETGDRVIVIDIEGNDLRVRRVS